MRYGLAILLAGLAVAAAVYLGSLRLNDTGRYGCFSTGGVAACYMNGSTRIADRAAWQIPVAVVIAALGVGIAGLMVRRRGDSGAL